MFSRAAFASGAVLPALAALLLSTSAAAAPPNQAPGAAAPASEVGADDEAPTPGRPLPRDDRTGHVSAFAGVSVVVPGGDLGGGVGLGQLASAGAAGEAGVAVGLTRYSGLELRGQFVRFGTTRECDKCQAQSFAAGLALTYHTAQAFAFDPWVRFGMGYRAMMVSGPIANLVSTAPSEGTFQGVDVASFTLGGDFFPTPWFGLGIFFAGDVGVNVASPGGVARGSVYGMFQAGLRIALEPQRKAVTAASIPAKTRTAIAEHSDFGPSLYNRAAR